MWYWFPGAAMMDLEKEYEQSQAELLADFEKRKKVGAPNVLAESRTKVPQDKSSPDKSSLGQNFPPQFLQGADKCSLRQKFPFDFCRGWGHKSFPRQMFPHNFCRWGGTKDPPDKCFPHNFCIGWTKIPSFIYQPRQNLPHTIITPEKVIALLFRNIGLFDHLCRVKMIVYLR